MSLELTLEASVMAHGNSTQMPREVFNHSQDRA